VPALRATPPTMRNCVWSKGMRPTAGARRGKTKHQPLISADRVRCGEETRAARGANGRGGFPHPGLARPSGSGRQGRRGTFRPR
jgi:hypothetical protein